MERKDGTPEPALATSPYTSSPLKTPLRPVNDADRKEMARNIYPLWTTTIPPEEMLNRLEWFGGDLPKDFPRFSGQAKWRVATRQYLTKISDVYEKEPAGYSIQFVEIGEKTPCDHPTGTRCRPDFAAIRKYPGSEPLTELHWSHLEATGEEKSVGTTEAEAHAQGASYTGYLLQARPDYIAVPGIFTNQNGFKLYITNACRCYCTDLIEWNSADTPFLLYAWIRRLYNPIVDKSIVIHRKPTGPPTFTIQIAGDKSYEDCSILRAGEPFGRRTIVFDAGEVVIKEQYVEEGRRFEESRILAAIHEGGDFPGVVRVRASGYVKSDEKEISLQHGDLTRKKSRLVLLDKGLLLMQIQTPREVLMALYDVLEVARTLWRKYKILHRDISPNNVLLRNEVVQPLKPLSKDLGDMCFSTHLLRSMESSSSAHPSDDESQLEHHRLATRVLLIDFDMSEDQTPGATSTRERRPRTGTPIFMARVVRSGQHPSGLFELPPLPELKKPLHGVYEQSVGERLVKFPPNKAEQVQIPRNSEISPFWHKLRYDAESVFWCLLWWCLQATPDDKDRDTIKREYWVNLTSEIDGRHANFIFLFPQNILHPEYRSLETLLTRMSEELSGDYDFAPSDSLRQHDEYLHEAFQRLILQFLFDNYNEPFMTLEKSPSNRPLTKDTGMSQSSRPSGTTSSAARSAASTSKRTAKDASIKDEAESRSIRRRHAE